MRRSSLSGDWESEQIFRAQCNLCCWPGRGAAVCWHDSPFCLGLLSPGSFHLIHLMFDDYVLYLLESLHCQERANELMRAMKGEGSTGKPALPWTLPYLAVWFVSLLLCSVVLYLALYPWECSYGEQVMWHETGHVFFFRMGMLYMGIALGAMMVMGNQWRALSGGVTMQSRKTVIF